MMGKKIKCIYCPPLVHTIPEVMIMEQDKQNTWQEQKEAVEQVETFNPLWHGDEFLGPNVARYKNSDDEREEQ